MAEFEYLIAELERKKDHIQRAIDEFKEAQKTHTPQERRRLQEAEAVASRRSRAAKLGWERRKHAPEQKDSPTPQRAA